MPKKPIVEKEPKIEKRMDYGPFFKSMFQTFGFTLLAFMGLLFLLFIVMWIKG